MCDTEHAQSSSVHLWSLIITSCWGSYPENGHKLDTVMSCIDGLLLIFLIGLFCVMYLLRMLYNWHLWQDFCKIEPWTLDISLPVMHCSHKALQCKSLFTTTHYPTGICQSHRIAQVWSNPDIWIQTPECYRQPNGAKVPQKMRSGKQQKLWTKKRSIDMQKDKLLISLTASIISVWGVGRYPVWIGR